MKNQNLENSSEERRYDLDWLRVIAFGVLIFYHIGMYYVADWQWHIKSDETSELLQDIMIFTNPWRMALLFFISGIAFAAVSKKFDSRFKLAWLRTKRLFIPLLFGMFVLVAPQVYIEFLDRGLIEKGFTDFWLHYINPNTNLLMEKQSIIGLLTWNHLWFLPYLWLYSLLILCFTAPLKRLAKSKCLAKIPLLGFTLFLMTLLIGVWLQLRNLYPTSHDLISDWYNHGKYLLAFTAGYLVFWQKSWWQQAIKARYWLLIIALACYAFIIADRHGAFPELAAAFQQSVLIKIFYGVIFSANIWCSIFAVLGLTGHFLNKPSKTLRYANEAVLPWYLLHQSVIVVLAWWIDSIGLPVAVEVTLLIVLTVLVCLLGAEVLKRVTVLSYLSGLNRKKTRLV